MDKEEVLPTGGRREKIMAPLVVLEYSIVNSSPLAYKIGCLANPIKNAVFTILIIALVKRAHVRNSTSVVLFLCCLCFYGNHAVLPALTNTLFTIHPPLLYIAISLSVGAIVLKKRRVVVVYLCAWAVSMFMGGFWSMQELSWGGWWNWDVIECGIAYQLALATYASHRAFRSSPLTISYSLAVSCSALLYTLLNKLGVGVSIHSFVTSASIQIHYGLILLIAAAFVIVWSSTGLLSCAVYLFILILLYCGTRSFSIVKPAIVWLLAVMPVIRTRRPLLHATHAIGLLTGVSILFFNYNNSAFFYSRAYKVSVLSISVSKGFWCIDPATPFRQKLIWDGIWLSKPRYACSGFVESWSTRSPALRSTFSAFCK